MLVVQIVHSLCLGAELMLLTLEHFLPEFTESIAHIVVGKVYNLLHEDVLIDIIRQGAREVLLDLSEALVRWYLDLVLHCITGIGITVDVAIRRYLVCSGGIQPRRRHKT